MRKWTIYVALAGVAAQRYPHIVDAHRTAVLDDGQRAGDPIVVVAIVGHQLGERRLDRQLDRFNATVAACEAAMKVKFET